MHMSSNPSEDIAREAQRVVTAAHLRTLAVAVLEQGEAVRTRARAVLRNGTAAATLKLERASERALARLSAACEERLERPVVGVLMRLASVIDGSEVPADALAEARRLIALGKPK